MSLSPIQGVDRPWLKLLLKLLNLWPREPAHALQVAFDLEDPKKRKKPLVTEVFRGVGEVNAGGFSKGNVWKLSRPKEFRFKGFLSTFA